MLSPPAASLLSVVFGVLVLAGIVVIARWSRNRTTYPSRAASVLSGAWSPLVAGIVTFVIRPNRVGFFSRTWRRARRARLSAAG